MTVILFATAVNSRNPAISGSYEDTVSTPAGFSPVSTTFYETINPVILTFRGGWDKFYSLQFEG